MHLVLDQSERATVVLLPDEMILASHIELRQYFIKDWSLTFMNPGNLWKVQINLIHLFFSVDTPHDGIQMKIIFKRRLTNELLTTYLPTIFLSIIVFCTTKFKPFFFEAALTVNLTVMLVITTLLISVMDKLPSTSYIRMIDVWLIFGQLLPFAEVVILTFMEANRIDEKQIVSNYGEDLEHKMGQVKFWIPKRSSSLNLTKPQNFLIKIHTL